MKNIMLRRKLFGLLLFLLIFSTLSLAAFAQPAIQEKSANVFGVKIFYQEAGDATKPKVILLHGLGADGASWFLNVAALSANYHVIIPDQVGFGRSDKPLIKYRVGTYVDFLDKFMQTLRIEKATLVGNSLGGWIAALTAIKYPNRVEKIVLADAAGLKPSEIDMKLIYSLNFSTREEVRMLSKLVFYDQTFVNNETFVEQSMEKRVLAGDGYTINSLIESIKRDEDFLDGQLSAIKKPTLIIWGRQDGLIKLADGERFNKEITGSQLIVFDKCSHIPQIEKAADFNREVLKFLEAK
jgi:pimeloyl-ACP methyl ester carboxylesterase